MKPIQLKIDSIFGGFAPAQYFSSPTQYLSGVGIDPDLPISDSVGDRALSGMIRPSGYAKFSSTNITGNVIAIITNPKDSNVYTVQSNGKFVSYSSAFGSETLVGTVTGSTASGGFYYNNYIYITGTNTGVDVARYGPLDGSPSLTNGVWTGATLGSQTALTNATYPSIRGAGTLPAHWGFVHTNNKAYVFDFKAGVGYVHAIITTKTTVEGDTNNGSVYGALTLPFGYMPVSGCSYGNDVVIAAIQTSNGTVQQGRSVLFFWDTTSSTWYNQVYLPDAFVTAVAVHNGAVYVFSGPMSNGTDSSNGYRISRHAGGQVMQEVAFVPSGAPPLQGAVESIGSRLCWGTFTQLRTTTAASPEYYAVVMALSSKSATIGGGMHCIVNSTATATAADGLVTAIRSVQQDSFAYPKFVVAWRDSGATGIDKQSTTYGTTVFRKYFNLGFKFKVNRIRIPLGTAVAANMTITPKIFVDDFSSSTTLPVINSTNYIGSERVIDYTFATPVAGINDFCLELRFSGTALLPVKLPITIDIEPITV